MQSVFLIYGIVFAALVLLGSLVMVDPPEGYSPAGWDPAEAAAVAKRNGAGFTPGEMLRTPAVLRDLAGVSPRPPSPA